MSHIALDSVLGQAQQLSPQDRLRLIELLSKGLQLDQPLLDDKASLLQQLYGSTREYPIERWDQGEYEEREPIE